jgi:hypothetical protein
MKLNAFAASTSHLPLGLERKMVKFDSS